MKPVSWEFTRTPSLRAVCPNRTETNIGDHHMPYINAAQIAGNLGKDAETSTTKAGKQVTRFSIASNKKCTDKAGKEHETTDSFRIAAWNNLAKFAATLNKGDPVLIQGELRTA